MSTVTGTTGASSATELLASINAGRAGGKDGAQELNDRFLKLLVAQMSNQDPLNPLDNAEVTSQMAQINTVTGINGLNDTVGQLLAQFARLETMQAAQLTGRDVLVEGKTLALAGDAAAAAGYQLPANADKVTVEVRDAAGALVRTIDLGAGKEGIQRFTWDGKTDAGVRAAAGSYTFSIKATAAGKDIGGTALAVRRVEAVSMAGGSTQLVLAGGGTIAYADIKQIL